MARTGQKMTQRQVAEAAGVSEAAVSAVLSGQAAVRRIAPKTVEQVRLAVQKLNYRSTRQSAGKKLNQMVGVILKDRVQHALSNPYYGEIFQGVEEVLDKEDFAVSIAKADDRFQTGKVARLLSTQKVDGLLLLGELSQDNLRWLSEFHTDMVSVNFVSGASMSSVTFDYRASRILAMEYLASKGHHRVAFLSSSLGTQNSLQEEEGYRMGLRPPAEPIMIYAKGGDIDHGREAMNAYLAANEKHKLPFTCLLGESDTLAAAAVLAFGDHGLRVPQDVSVMGGQNYQLPGLGHIKLTTTSLDKVEMGRLAARQLLWKIRGESSTAVRMVMPTEIIERETVAPI